MNRRGAKTKYVEIQQVADSVPTGFPVETGTSLGFAWMERKAPTSKELDGRERFAADQVTAPQMTTWVMWFQPNMDPEVVDVPKTRRLKYEGRVYNITTAVPVGQRHEIELRTLSGGLES